MPPNSSTPDVMSPSGSSPAVLPPNTFNTVVLKPNSSTPSVDNNATPNAGRMGKRKRFNDNVDSNRLDDDHTRTSSTSLGNSKKKHVHKPV